MFFHHRSAILCPGIAQTAVSGLSLIILILSHSRVNMEFLQSITTMSISRQVFLALAYITLGLYLCGGLLAIAGVDLVRPVVIASTAINLVCVVFGGLFMMAVLAPSLVSCQNMQACTKGLEDLILGAVLVSLLMVILSGIISAMGFVLIRQGLPPHYR